MQLTQKQARAVRDLIKAAAKLGQGSVRCTCYGNQGFKMRCNDTWSAGPIAITSLERGENVPVEMHARYSDFCRAYGIAP